jgi:Tfp pilus assembly protein PilV
MTLVEVMIAMFILTLVFASSAAAMLRTFPALDTARSVTVAGQMMQDEMERLRLMNWTTLNAVANGPVTIDSRFSSNPAIASRFTVNRTITAVSTNMRQITITVSWTGNDGRTRSRSYESLYGKDGIYDFITSNS